ncbi:MAG: rod shape-determining protein MreD [Candidatus Margulisbacteria bacterium]|nr:rod shape-determining protein MreD [Candidatus Margulisiibacteriota bacterium]MBU1021470.1 rod shape-determining protein MreD [Candidatus Margulisiibacteriota bacterium]MBU1728391.1 rod shape-determining protein MreD [Candidatus Margulisiibacteriota bacterium]MBU1955866.1 rod shape-determining protein MreD [Candidatus Margulisiibacteriota bacterium]
MNSFKYTFFLILLFILQTVFLPRFTILGAYANLFFVLVIIVSVLRGSRLGALYGLGFGILLDLFSSGLYAHTISLVLFAFVVMMIEKSFAGDDLKSTLTLILILSPLYGLFNFGLLRVIYNLNFALSGVLIVLLVSTAFNVVAGFLMYSIVRRHLVGPGVQVRKSDVITHF